MLALNVSIEAASTGGKGFSVVASEVVPNPVEQS
ncbi:hypothetical protein [Ligilactobacillus ruminis]|nr:hypothetical protein [Ligilactobacillus ruminis]